MPRRDAPVEKPGDGGAFMDGSGQIDELRVRQGVLKYKCYSTTQVDSKGNPVLLREAGLFSKIPEQPFICSDINQNFTMLAVRWKALGLQAPAEPTVDAKMPSRINQNSRQFLCPW